MVFLDYPDIPKVTAILADEVGTHEEHGPNDGTCATYQRAIGGEEAVQRHDSWCLYLVLWGLLQLVGARVMLAQLVPAVTGSCQDFRLAARRRGQLLPIGTAPRAGDIGLVVRAEDDHAHHAFWLATSRAENAGAGLTTIEGNSNNTGGSNGDGTYTRDKRWGASDPATKPGASNRYELVRITDPTIPVPAWLP